MSVRGPTAAILFFACPKKSIQKKRHPDAACFLRSGAFDGGCRKGLPAPSSTRRIPAAPLRADPAKSSGARRGIRETPTSKPESFRNTFGCDGVAPNSEAYSEEGGVFQAFFGRAYPRWALIQHASDYAALIGPTELCGFIA